MHQKLLSVNESTVKVRNLQSNKVVSICSIVYDEVRDFLIINLMSEMTPQTHYEISIVYNIAKVEEVERLGGIYMDRYFDPLTNQTKVLVTTQLQPLGARRMFPCFDEPSYKASFEVVIGRTGRFSSLSNSPLIGTQPDLENRGWCWDSFNATVPMPTYLLAIGISEYTFYESKSGLYRLPVRVYGPRHLINEGKGILAANATAMLMDYFEEKYSIPYKMPKLDSISLPKKQGAMENYGLITCSEDYIILDKENSTHDTLRKAFQIIAHELSHQWFGNLVTCKWWSDIWFNEGFARYISYKTVQALWPHFHMDTFMVKTMTNVALQVDATAASHPVHMEFLNAAQIRQNFDHISYNKGGSLVNMMASFLGEGIFDLGSRHYLNYFQDSVVTQENLFETLESTAVANDLVLPRKLADIMHTWTLESGFPLIRVKYLKDNNCIIFTQEPWRKGCARDSAKNFLWDVPIQYMVKLSDQFYYHNRSLWLLKEDSYPKAETLHNKLEWILTNPDARGYYRTEYDMNLARGIQEQLRRNHTTFPVVARVRLMDDQLTLGFEGYVAIQRSPEFMNYLGNETDPSVWSIVLSKLQKLRWCFAQNSNETVSNIFKTYFHLRVGQARENVGKIVKNNYVMEAEPHSKLHSELVKWSCELGSEWCTEYTTRLFEEWLLKPDINLVPMNMQSTIYCKMVDVMGQPAYMWMQKQYKMAGFSTSVKSRIASSFGCVTDNFQIVTQMAIERKGITTLDSLLVLRKILKHTIDGRNFLLLKLRTASKWIDNYGWTMHELVQLLYSVEYTFSTHDDLNHLEEILFENYALFQDSLNELIDITKQNIAWFKENRNNITNWLNSQV